MKMGMMFRILGIALFIQLALGGLVTFNYIGAGIHTLWGIALGVLAIVALVFVIRMPSKPKQLVGITVGIGVDILIQGLLGFATLDTGSNALAWLHFLNALAIFAMTLAGTFMAMAASRMVPSGPMPPETG
jgi:heme A synthase